MRQSSPCLLPEVVKRALDRVEAATADCERREVRGFLSARHLRPGGVVEPGFGRVDQDLDKLIGACFLAVEIAQYGRMNVRAERHLGAAFNAGLGERLHHAVLTVCDRHSEDRRYCWPKRGERRLCVGLSKGCGLLPKPERSQEKVQVALDFRTGGRVPGVRIEVGTHRRFELRGRGSQRGDAVQHGL